MSFGFGVGDFLAALELAGKVRQNWVDAPIEYASIRAEVRNVENILRSLHETSGRIQIDAQQCNDLKEISTSCIEVLHRADEIVEKYSSLQKVSKTLSGRVRRSWKQLRLDPEDIRNVRNQLTSTMTQLGAIQNNIELGLVQEVTGKIDSLQLDQQQQRIVQVADWFAPSSFAEHQSDQLARRYEGTANWFLRDKRYIDWRQNTNKTLFCPGVPGSGKTILAATIVDDLCQHFVGQNGVLVTYFYFNFKRQSEQSLDQILAILVRQLFQEQPDLPKPVIELYEKHKARKTRPSQDESKSLLRQLILIYKQVFVVIDALDESTNNDRARDKLLDMLSDLQTQAEGNVNLLCTSRNIPMISIYFENYPKIEITAQNEDIERYIDGHMGELCLGVRNNKALQDDIRLKITSSADGMFLLARLQFESLEDKMNAKAVRQALDGLSQKPQLEALDLAYEEAMERINKQRKGFCEIAKKVLAWIVFARQELVVEQLQEAIAIEPGIDEINRDEDLVDEDALISVCAGLVTIDQTSRVVRLVHHTTQDFFERTNLMWLPGGQELVARTCINFLCMDWFTPIVAELRKKTAIASSNLEILDTYKLSAYVGAQWGFHTALLDGTKEYVDEILRNEVRLALVCHLLIAHSPVFYTTYYSRLSVCAYFNDTRAIRLLLDSGADPNEIVHIGGHTALSVAAGAGHQDIIVELLSRPAIDINISMPLSMAAHWGRSEIVKMLVARPEINVNLGMPLLEACFSGNHDVVDQLLALPAVDVNLGHPLRQAAAHGHEEVIRKLLTHTDVDANLGNPLYQAAYMGRLDIVEQLLARPEIDINAGQPILVATRQGFEPVVRVLLARPEIEVDLRGAFLFAVYKGHRDIVKLLRPRLGIEK